MSFAAVPENSQHWSWGDVGQQTVPEAASFTLYAACIGQIIKQSNIHCNSSVVQIICCHGCAYVSVAVPRSYRGR